MDREQVIPRIVELLGWIGVAGVGFVMLTQAFGWNGTRLVAALQALTPFGIPLVLTIAGVSLWQRHEALAATGALVGIGAFVLSFPLIVAPGQESPDQRAVGMTVASLNLLYSNSIVDRVADDMVALDPDVIVFSEYTPEHRTTFHAHPLADSYPNQINRDGQFSGGMAIWSKFPLEENERTDPAERTVDAILTGPDGPTRLLSVHPTTPIHDFRAWERSLDEVGHTAASEDRPTLVIGDFNATYWHPVFRALMRRGLTDAHIAHGSGWSTSWPNDTFIPPFVRLDHALTGNGLVSTDVADFDVPGSDHVGFVVTVAPAAVNPDG